jgi:predicted nuclease of restriction endonuclease-like (RecB) superfamily
LYERTVLSRQPDAVIQNEVAALRHNQAITPQLFLKDPYLLDFLDLKDNFTEVVELMDLEPDNIHIAEYWLKLPPKEVLQAKLHKAMIEAKARLEFRRGGDGDE